MTIAVPMLDLARQHRALAADLLPRWQALLEAGQFIGGAEVERLEREVAAYLGVRHAVAMNSGTDALLLALRAAGVGAGDEVITTPFSFVATAATIVHAGARPVFADIDPQTFNLSPASVARAVTARTKAIVPVHLFGQPADMPALLDIARGCGAVVIEDCAQSFGATLDGRQTGTFGLAGAFSFYPTKNLAACGDGGIVVTDSEDFAARVRRLANHGAGAPQEYLVCGFNSRLDALQAAALRVKLARVDAWNAARRAVAARYAELLRGLPVVTPHIAPGRTHVFHQHTVLLPQRDRVAQALREAGIGHAIFYPRPLYRQPALAAYAPPHPLPVAEDVCGRCLSLPVFPELEGQEIEAVAAALARALTG